MSSCCHTAPSHPAADAAMTVALAGNPNCGKTTLFNALTGLRQKVTNYPGITVERKVGRLKLLDGRWVNLIDLPGTYSLISRSPDEIVAMEVLRGLRPDTPAPDVVVVVVDASNLQRNLYLVSQLVELGRPMVIALNMMDVAKRRGIEVTPAALAHELGVPVVPIVAHRRIGLDRLKAAIVSAQIAPMPDWVLPDAMKEELLVVGGGLAILDGASGCECLKDLTTVKSDEGKFVLPAIAERRQMQCVQRMHRLDRYQALAERLLIGDNASDLKAACKAEPIMSLVASAKRRMSALGIEPVQADIEAHYRWIETVAARSSFTMDPEVSTNVAGTRETASHEGSGREPVEKVHFSERLDRLFMHRFWGLLVFTAIMASLFVSIFWLADPIMTAVESSVNELGGWVAGWLPDGGPLQALVADGIFAGVGAVVVFVPQIALLFLFLSILEDSGYLARAAFLMDKLLAKVGLSGKSFIPLLSSFACAIPGIMATRVIENRRDRLATIFVAPFMSCSARLPVYMLLIGTFFAGYGAWLQGGILLGCYCLGILAAAGTSWVLSRSNHGRRGPAPSFILEMPSYKFPQISQVARQVYSNTKEFLVKAGTIIFAMSIILWAMAYYPRLSDTRADEAAQAALQEVQLEPGLSAEQVQEVHDQAVAEAIGGAQLRHSIAGQFGHLLEPIIRPIGFDWKMGVGLVSAFAAREVFVSTMGIVYSVGDVDTVSAPLSQAMKSDRYPDGSSVWTPLTALSLLIWFILALQCISTVAIVRRETGGWTWPVIMQVYMNSLAYAVCFVVYQGGSWLFR